MLQERLQLIRGFSKKIISLPNCLVLTNKFSPTRQILLPCGAHAHDGVAAGRSSAQDRLVHFISKIIITSLRSFLVLTNKFFPTWQKLFPRGAHAHDGAAAGRSTAQKRCVLLISKK
jgi:hypothetical protein